MSTHRPFSWREQLYGLILAGAIGLGVGFLLSLSQRPAERWVSLLSGAFAALGISRISRALGRLLQARLDPLAGARRTAAYAILFLVSGVAAWTLAGVVINALFGLGIPLFSRVNLLSITITGA